MQNNQHNFFSIAPTGMEAQGGLPYSSIQQSVSSQSPMAMMGLMAGHGGNVNASNLPHSMATGNQDMLQMNVAGTSPGTRPGSGHVHPGQSPSWASAPVSGSQTQRDAAELFRQFQLRRTPPEVSPHTLSSQSPQPAGQAADMPLLLAQAMSVPLASAFIQGMLANVQQAVQPNMFPGASASTTAAMFQMMQKVLSGQAVPGAAGPLPNIPAAMPVVAAPVVAPTVLPNVMHPAASQHSTPPPPANQPTIQLPPMDTTVAKALLVQLAEQLQRAGQLPNDDTFHRLLQSVHSPPPGMLSATAGTSQVDADVKVEVKTEPGCDVQYDSKSPITVTNKSPKKEFPGERPICVVSKTQGGLSAKGSKEKLSSAGVYIDVAMSASDTKPSVESEDESVGVSQDSGNDLSDNDTSDRLSKSKHRGGKRGKSITAKKSSTKIKSSRPGIKSGLTASRPGPASSHIKICDDVKLKKCYVKLIRLPEKKECQPEKSVPPKEKDRVALLRQHKFTGAGIILVPTASVSPVPGPSAPPKKEFMSQSDTAIDCKQPLNTPANITTPLQHGTGASGPQYGTNPSPVVLHPPGTAMPHIQPARGPGRPPILPVIGMITPQVRPQPAAGTSLLANASSGEKSTLPPPASNTQDTKWDNRSTVARHIQDSVVASNAPNCPVRPPAHGGSNISGTSLPIRPAEKSIMKRPDELPSSLEVDVLRSINTSAGHQLRSMYMGLVQQNMEWLSLVSCMRRGAKQYCQCIFCPAVGDMPRDVALHISSEHPELLFALNKLKQVLGPVLYINCRHCDFVAVEPTILWIHFEVHHGVQGILDAGCHPKVDLSMNDPPPKVVDLDDTLGNVSSFVCFDCGAVNADADTAQSSTMMARHVLRAHPSTLNYNGCFVKLMMLQRVEGDPDSIKGSVTYRQAIYDEQHARGRREVFVCMLCRYSAFCSYLALSHSLMSHQSKHMLFICSDCTYQCLSDNDVVQHMTSQHRRQTPSTAPLVCSATLVERNESGLGYTECEVKTNRTTSVILVKKQPPDNPENNQKATSSTRGKVKQTPDHSEDEQRSDVKKKKKKKRAKESSDESSDDESSSASKDCIYKRTSARLSKESGGKDKLKLKLKRKHVTDSSDGESSEKSGNKRKIMRQLQDGEEELKKEVQDKVGAKKQVECKQVIESEDSTEAKCDAEVQSTMISSTDDHGMSTKTSTPELNVDKFIDDHETKPADIEQIVNTISVSVEQGSDGLVTEEDHLEDKPMMSTEDASVEETSTVTDNAELQKDGLESNCDSEMADKDGPTPFKMPDVTSIEQATADKLPVECDLDPSSETSGLAGDPGNCSVDCVSANELREENKIDSEDPKAENNSVVSDGVSDQIKL